ncbi:MAG: cell division protein FtsB [Alcaligenaceae bacterium]|nr:cell division protein FtsB [Alcaligenaceae bacterium]
MRLLVLVLALLTLVTQYPLWWGKGGWFQVQDLQAQIASQQEANQVLAARNNALLAEVRDLKSGTQAIEERARSELGMVRKGEYFVQILPREGADSKDQQHK